jgi:hypothetical protein
MIEEWKSKGRPLGDMPGQWWGYLGHVKLGATGDEQVRKTQAEQLPAANKARWRQGAEVEVEMKRGTTCHVSVHHMSLYHEQW